MLNIWVCSSNWWHDQTLPPMNIRTVIIAIAEKERNTNRVWFELSVVPNLILFLIFAANDCGRLELARAIIRRIRSRQRGWQGTRCWNEILSVYFFTWKKCRVFITLGRSGFRANIYTPRHSAVSRCRAETVIRAGLFCRAVPCTAVQNAFSVSGPVLSRPVREKVRTPGQVRTKIFVPWCRLNDFLTSFHSVDEKF